MTLVPGFGENAESNVYQKMRREFADQYNLIVIQCNYFGSEYMQSSNISSLSMNIEYLSKLLSPEDFQKIKSGNLTTNQILKEISKYECNLEANAQLKEDIKSFNDMGFMQALDILTAVHAVKIILKDNRLSCNSDKTIIYGHSHGAFLAYLCNRLAPQEFDLIIYNSAWLKPVYLTSPRYLSQQIGKMKIHTNFDYYARQVEYDKSLLNLPILYKDFTNQAMV
ncbi:DUF2920 family protein [Virgibacillus halodenitrificans]|uniref:DUF2920 family protein n=1 Tax=Virgibacillus halodenitrificans TaxID=1482 RepID=UPI001F22B68D